MKEIAEAIIAAEQDISCGSAYLVQGHGDFHPKNIMIGQDSQDNRDTTFVAAIDFGSSLMLPPAFDLGTFLGQYRKAVHPSGTAATAAGNDLHGGVSG